MRSRIVEIEGYPDYLVTDQGDVISLKYGRRKVMRGMTKKTGYRSVGLCDGSGKVLQRLVHHLVLEAFTGYAPQGMETRHLDGNPQNNRLENLKWGTPSENGADRVRHGTAWGPALIGTNNPRA